MNQAKAKMIAQAAIARGYTGIEVEAIHASAKEQGVEVPEQFDPLAYEADPLLLLIEMEADLLLIENLKQISPVREVPAFEMGV